MKMKKIFFILAIVLFFIGFNSCYAVDLNMTDDTDLTTNTSSNTISSNDDEDLNENESNNFAVDKNKNCLYVSYKPNGENPGIYLLDFTTNSFSQIISLNDLTGELLLKGNSLVIDVTELGKIYVYNSAQNSVAEIGDNNLSKTSYHIAFYNDYILYTNGEKIDIKDSSGNSYKDDWYVLDDSSIAGISMISSNKLQIARFNENKQVSESIIIDLENGNAIQFPDTVYSELVTIK